MLLLLLLPPSWFPFNHKNQFGEFLSSPLELTTDDGDGDEEDRKSERENRLFSAAAAAAGT